MRVEGINGFCDYAQMFFGAFTNLYHVIEDVVVEGDKAAVRLVYSGIHTGKLFGFEYDASESWHDAGGSGAAASHKAPSKQALEKEKN